MLYNIKVPIIVLNLKAYPHVLNADDALKYALIAEEVAEESGVSIIVAPPQYHLSYVAKNVKIPVIAQHADPIEAGAATGFVPLEAVKGAGAIGSLINHSEHRLKLADINYLVQKAKALDLVSIVCTDVYETSLAAAALEPNFIAIEPPELIGGDISVTTAKPEIITRVVEGVSNISDKVRILTGAGIKRKEDVKKAVELGTDGVLLASGFVKAKNPKDFLRDLVSVL